MANTQAPFGFRQLRRFDGGAPTAGFDRLFLASSDPSTIFTGDPVVTATTGPYVTAASTGNSQIRGIFMGCEYYSAAFNQIRWSPYYPGPIATGGADVQCWVCTDPEMLYIAQGSTSGVIGSTTVNLNIGFTVNSSLGNTMSGVSAAVLASSTISSTLGLPFRISDLYSNYAPPGTNGTDNTSAGNIVVVAPNNWDRSNLTGI